MGSPNGPSLQTPSYNTNRCSCTRLLFLACNHAQLLKSNSCQFSIHSPSPENLLVWEKETCADVHKEAEFVLPLCTALEDPHVASKIDFGMVSFDCQYWELPIATMQLCGESERTPISSEPSRVRFLLPYASNAEWAPKTSAFAAGSHDEDRYEESTRQFNKSRREMSEVSQAYRIKILLIELKIYDATRQHGACSEPCLRKHHGLCQCALEAQRQRVMKEERETKDILTAKLGDLRVQRERAADGVLVASTA